MNKNKIISIVLLISLFFSATAFAQLEPWKDFEVSDEIIMVNMVKVKPNMMNDYLEGLRDTWVASNRVAKELGHIVDYAIYQSEVPNGGDANLTLVVVFENSAALEPNKARYEEFMEAWGAENRDKTREITKNYPGMREIIGAYRMRKIDIK